MNIRPLAAHSSLSVLCTVYLASEHESGLNSVSKLITFKLVGLMNSLVGFTRVLRQLSCPLWVNCWYMYMYMYVSLLSSINNIIY